VKLTEGDSAFFGLGVRMPLLKLILAAAGGGAIIADLEKEA
jgi:hypothetical protein